MNNKKNVLLAFGALAIVLVAVLAIWRPPALRNEDASGAIGAVQKHRAPQIAQKDVILGDEATKEEQSVLFGDFLEDSGKLQATSNTFNAMAANKLDSRQVEAASKNLADISDALQARYAARLAAFVTAANRMAAKSNDAKLAANLSELATRLNARLSAVDMEAMNARVAAITAAAGARAESRSSIDLAQRQVAEAMIALQNRQGPEAAARLASATEELASRAYGPSLAQMDDYLQAITLEAKAVTAAQSRLASAPMNESRLMAISKDLAGHAIDLESRALNNMKARTADQAEMATRLAAIDAQIDAANKLAASEASAMAAKAENISTSLAGVRTALQARQADFAARTASAIELELGTLSADHQLGPTMIGLDAKLAAREAAEHRLGPAFFGLDAKLAAREAGNRVDMANHIMAVRNLAARPDLSARVNTRVLNDAAELQQRLAAKAN